MKKFFIVAGIIFGSLVLVGVLLFIGMGYIVSSNSVYKGDYKAVKQSNDPSAPKALLVFQPSMGEASTQFAEQLANGLNKAGYEVTMSYPGQHLSSDISAYSLVVFGSPVYAGKPSQVIIDYMNGISDYAGKKVVLYSVGSMEKALELEVMAESIKGTKPVKAVKFLAGNKDSLAAAYQLGLDMGKE